MNCVAIIPARGGSKRIPGKNIKPFLGKPIMAYSIEEAKKSGLFESVIVSTDDERIAEVAREYGAEVPFLRPAELADDFTGTAEVVSHCLEWLKDHSNKTYDYACCIYATAPFIQASYLRKGLDILVSSGKESSYSVTSYSFPIQRAVKIVNGVVLPFDVEAMSKRSQDLEEAFHDAGQFYWYKESRLERPEILQSGAMPVILPRYLVQDIDTAEDWVRAEVMYEVLERKGYLS